ncbi:MAG: alpha/beta hydrolase [Prevotellaceae bacterium]|nr:alpha/beta hydrolase [Prevotellaceae bacterium]MDY3364914.1 alpha/beta hydrolase [Prevotella sp.]
MTRTKQLLMTLCLLCFSLTGMAQRSFNLPLWEGKPKVKSKDANDTAQISVFLPDAKTATGRAVVICPGGGYKSLSMDTEGTHWASFFNNIGIAAIVLKYRMPNGKKEVPISDAEEAMKTVRRNATAWKINPNQVGIMGFSAGGHLAATLATKSKGEAKPNFQILFYPVITMMSGYTHQGSHDNFLGKNPGKKEEREYSADQMITRETPPAWIVLSDDDQVVTPANGANYYIELYRHDVPASLHVYQDGGHGWGRKDSFKYKLEMELNLKAWLHNLR